MFLQIVLQSLGNSGIDHTCHFGVTEFGFCLSLKLRFSHFDRDNCGQTFTEIVRVDGRVTIFVFEFCLLEHFALLGIFLHHTREGGTETGYVRTTFDSVDIIDVRVYVLIEVGIVDHSHLNRRTVFLGVEMDDLADKRRTRTIDVTNELREALLGVEHFLLAVTLCVHYTLILEHDFDAGIEESEFAHSVRQNLPVVNRFGKDGIIGPELHERTCFALLPVTDRLLFGDCVHRSKRFAFCIILAVDSAVTIDLYVHRLRERVHAADADTVETTGHFVAILIKLTTGMEDGHNDFQRGLMLLRVHIDRNTTSVILDSNGVILVDMNGYLVTETGERLIDGVIHHFINKVVQTLERYIADIHRGAFAHSL